MHALLGTLTAVILPKQQNSAYPVCESSPEEHTVDI